VRSRLCALIVAVVALGAHSAYATTIGLQISSGGNSITIGANGSLSASGNVTTMSSSTAPGVVSWYGQLGSWSVNFTQGIGSPVLPNGTIDLNSFNVSSGGPGTLTVKFTQANNPITLSNSSMVIPGFNLAVGGTMASNFSSVNYSAYINPNTTNALFGQSQLLGSLTFNQSGAFSGSTSTSVNLSAPYSLTQVLNITSNGGVGSFSANASLTPTPEPASLLLLGGGLSGIVLLTRLRRSRASRK
jgi:PEP-CTERM motif-containing protein